MTGPAWVKCDCCDDYLCTIHDGFHAHECDCLPIDEWVHQDPYSGEMKMEMLKVSNHREKHSVSWRSWTPNQAFDEIVFEHRTERHSVIEIKAGEYYESETRCIERVVYVDLPMDKAAELRDMLTAAIDRHNAWKEGQKK